MKHFFAVAFTILAQTSCSSSQDENISGNQANGKTTNTGKGNKVIKNFYPSEKTVEKFDTTVQGGQIHIIIEKRDLDSFVVNEYEDEEGKHLDKYRDASISLIVKNKSHIIIDTIFNKEQFLSHAGKEFLDIAIFHNYWFEGINNGHLKFIGVISKPETDWTFAFNHLLKVKDKTLQLIPLEDNEE